MTQTANKESEPVRLLFEMTREDNPRLYDDLVRFNKGTKRVNRLRFLAHEGLLAQGWLLVPAPGPAAQSAVHAPSVGHQSPLMKVDPVAAGHVVQAFDAPSEAGAE